MPAPRDFRYYQKRSLELRRAAFSTAHSVENRDTLLWFAADYGRLAQKASAKKIKENLSR